MNEHVTDWIAAYYDGELRGARLRQVEAHLQGCAACQAELQGLKDLSTLLQKNPAMPPRTAPDRFVSQVRLRLVPHSTPAGWLLLPLGVLGVWAFLQAVLVVSAFGLLVLPWVGGLPLPAAPEWYAGEAVLSLFVLNAWLTVVLTALIWGWLAGWWAVRRKPVTSSGEMTE